MKTWSQTQQTQITQVQTTWCAIVLSVSMCSSAGSSQINGKEHNNGSDRSGDATTS